MNMQPNQLAESMRQLCVYALMALFVTLVWAHSSHAEEISQSDQPVEVNEEGIDITQPPIEEVPIFEVDRGGLDDTHVDLPEKTCTEYYIDANGVEQSRTYPCP